MEPSDRFWNASLTELKRGYVQDSRSYSCLLCGENVEKGIIHPYEDRLYEAESYMRIHIDAPTDPYLKSGMDKKLTGLTDRQRDLLLLFYQRKSDTQVQKELGIGSTSTIRHHRFSLKEKKTSENIFDHDGIAKRKRRACPCIHARSSNGKNGRSTL